MLIKIHKMKDREVISLCDEELIGKKFEEKDLQLEISERFYKGEKLPEEEIVKILKNVDNINIVGKKSVDLALKNKLISKKQIIKIKGIPHAQIISV